ncbi:MAG TPA: hypothetical protein EYP14_01330, partial [Planctomycetaceae bacterium]|nr:hypothetical protein [Planctomycetaceae bacterium]
MVADFLKISPRISVFPVVHGSGDCAVEVRRVMLSESFDCLAVPLPASFQKQVEQAIPMLPRIAVVVQPEPWAPDGPTDRDAEPFDRAASYVPIDPCQPVIA